jgi:hypothetical protein
MELHTTDCEGKDDATVSLYQEESFAKVYAAYARAQTKIEVLMLDAGGCEGGC